MRLLLTLACLGVVVGCGDSGQDGGGGGGGGATTGDLGIEALDLSQRQTINLMDASDGDTFAIVLLGLENRTAESLSLAPTQFSVRTSSGIEFPGHILTGLVEDGCPVEGSLAQDGSIQCAVVFEVPEDATLEVVAYRPPGGSKSWEAALPEPMERMPPTTCAEYAEQVGDYIDPDCSRRAANSCTGLSEEGGAACQNALFSYYDCVLDHPEQWQECSPVFGACSDEFDAFFLCTEEN